MQNVWSEFLKLVHDEVGSRVVETWFKALSLYDWDEKQNIVYVSAPNRFVKEWVCKHYYATLQLNLGRLLHTVSPKIEFIDAHGPSKQSSSQLPRVVGATKIKEDGAIAPISKKITGAYLNRSYQFESFIVGPSNSLAFAAAQAVAKKPGILYNPLFIYGGAGLGKTHLLHAIGNEIKKNHKHASVLYQTTDRFVTEFITAIRFDKIHKFKSKYQAVDVLLIDDLQFISNKEQTQEAFFHIFNSLYNAEKQIVFSSDTFPQDMDGIAQRLRSRIVAGLITDICRPSLETKIAILKKKAAMQQELVPDDVAHFIATHVTSNIRELEGALIRLLAFATLTKQAVTVELAQKVLMRLVEQKQASVDFRRIVTIIEEQFSFSLEDLRSKSRNKELAFTRQVTMYLMKQLTTKSLRDIGSYLGGRDHSTVMHAVDKVADQIKNDTVVRNKIKELKEAIVN